MARTANDTTAPQAHSAGVASLGRAKLISGFDTLPDDALVSVPTAAAVLGKGESTFWKDAKDKPNHPRVVKVSTRCSRVRVGSLRHYLRTIGAVTEQVPA